LTVGNLGPVVSSSKVVAQAVANAKMGLAEDGDVAALIGSAVQLFLFHCLKTGSGFTKDEIYYPEYDTSMIRSAWRSIFWDHDHSGNGSKHGGSLLSIYMANLAKAFVKHNGPVPGEWRTRGDGSLTRVAGTTSDYLRFQTLAALNSTISGFVSGHSLTFTDIIDLQLYTEALQNTDIFARFGINVDAEDESQSNSRRQFGFECCPASGTTWTVISANGAAANLLQVATTLDISSSLGDYQLTLHPGVDIKAYYDGVLKGTTNSANTPSDGSSDIMRQLVCGVKTNIGNTRELRLRHYHILGNPSDIGLKIASST
jgi:hypothetical protein